MKVTSKQVHLTEKELMYLQMGLNTLEIGKMIEDTVMVKKSQKMAPNGTKAGGNSITITVKAS